MMFETAAFLWFSTVTIKIVNNYSKILKSIAFISVCAGVDRLNGLFTVITHAPGACQNLKTPIFIDLLVGSCTNTTGSLLICFTRRATLTSLIE